MSNVLLIHIQDRTRLPSSGVYDKWCKGRTCPFCEHDTAWSAKAKRYVNSISAVLDRKEQYATTGIVSSECLTVNIHVVGSFWCNSTLG